MEWESDSNSSVDDNDSNVTPKQGVSLVSIEELTLSFSEMRGACQTPILKRSASKPTSRLPSGAKGKVLFPRQEQMNAKWLNKEVYALTIFLMLHTDGKSWVTHKDKKFWEDAGSFVQLHSQSVHRRTGASCRAKVLNVLAKQFHSPAIAEKHYQSLSQADSVSAVPTISQPSISTSTVSLPQIPNVSSAKLTISQPPVSSLILPPLNCPSASIVTQSSVLSCSAVPSSCQSAIFLSSPTPLQCDSLMTVGHMLSALCPVSITPLSCTSRTIPSTSLSTASYSCSCEPPPQCSQSSLSITVGHVLSKLSSDSDLKSDPVQVEKNCQEQLRMLSSDQQCKVLSKLFGVFVTRYTDIGCLPSDFLELSVHAMIHLKHCHRSNVIYLLAKALGTMRPDQSDSLLPAKRMPMGLIEYSAKFFTASSTRQIICPSDYRSWLQTMYVLFGTKWCKLFTGPMWSHETVSQADVSFQQSRSTDPVKALVNIPGLSERTLRRDIASTDFSTEPKIQVAVLQKLASLNPGARWWIKGDGTDVVKGLWLSVSGEWSGDVDLNDGKLQHLYTSFRDTLTWISKIGLDTSDIAYIKKDIEKALAIISSDLNFISIELQTVNSNYEEKLKSNSTTDQTKFSLSWDIEELKDISKECRKMYSDLTECSNACTSELFQQSNVPRKLAQIRERLCELTKRIVHFKREPATHIFVLMISSDARDKKPYALPVQWFPYTGLKESDIRRIVSELCKKMISLGMKVSGFTSDGEFNYLRSKGYTRPLSVLQIRSNIRNKYSKISRGKLIAMLTPKRRLPDGTVIAELDNEAVPQHVLSEICSWREQGISMEDILQRLRPRTVPPGYKFHTWKPGESEGPVEQMRSILAQFDFVHLLRQYEAQGVSFCTYLYVPEIHPETKAIFYEREDEAHLLKRIASHTRSGGPANIKLERYTEAVRDPTSGMTYPALIGARKQSVIDAERLFSSQLSTFMRKKGYDVEATYIETIHNWRRASDERGLSSLMRSKYNYCLLNMILDELMPWHKETYNFALLEVNRSLKNVLGFSKETLSALITNIEGREWHRRECGNTKRPIEHPRASSTDDVECFFSMVRDAIGRNFTTKEVKFEIRKVFTEFAKRVDPDLPFYYHTSSHTRYYEGPLPEFDKPSKKRPKERRIPRREQPAAFGPRRATMPVRGSLSVRPQFHNIPLELPPPPDSCMALFEHSYACNTSTRN